MATVEIETPPLGGPGGALEFTWDDETGEVTGPAAGQVLAAAEEARELGEITDVSGLRTAADPLRTREGMAMLLLHMLYRVPEELQGDLPEPPESEGESDVPIEY